MLDRPRGRAARPLPTVLLVLATACAGAAAQRPARPAAPPEFFMNVDGTAGKLRASVGGEGEPAVVFVHGLGSDLEVWRAQLDHVRLHHAAVAYDQRGHGESDRASDGVYTIDALAADLDAVIHALKLRRVVLVGHSMSGAVLTTYAGRHPDVVAGLVYVDALGDLRGLPRPDVQAMLASDATRTTTPAIREGFAQMLGPSARPATRDQVLGAVARLDPPAFAALRRSLTQISAKERFAPYRGPAIAIEVGDRPVPFMAAAMLGLPRLEVSNVSHWLQLDEPDALNGKLDAFLAGIR
ncbi:alpha/beta fold hydrolase [Anaeromyxobacter oryzae]|uniref:Hydrolase n=1 Tax=Anaeromyxobacter oryzae TaxID=2918170 RepID=A0ABN6MXB0_9BACT|nr:alpha/beta hydrolase [Anaeromyxobacter oryzae]BDG04900.1 hydrolase [Anaeromyxobacter oryzae]